MDIFDEARRFLDKNWHINNLQLMKICNSSKSQFISLQEYLKNDYEEDDDGFHIPFEKSLPPGWSNAYDPLEIPVTEERNHQILKEWLKFPLEDKRILIIGDEGLCKTAREMGAHVNVPPYDFAILYDVLDHEEDPVSILYKARRMVSKAFVRCHPWTARDGGHPTINRAYVHLFSDKYVGKTTHKLYNHPYKEWFSQSDWIVSGESYIFDEIDDFIDMPFLWKKICSHFPDRIHNSNTYKPYHNGYYPKANFRNVGVIPVGSYPPNAFDLYDMHGNVWEWCLDSYNVRGGGCWDEPELCRSASRPHVLAPETKHADLGFRIICNQEISENVLGMKFSHIPINGFWMGSPEWEENRNENEQRQWIELIKPFWMSKFATTNKNYKDVLGFGSSGEDNMPAVKVSWYQANNFCNLLGKIDGMEYRLPTEAEWEYACRGLHPNAVGELIKIRYRDYVLI